MLQYGPVPIVPETPFNVDVPVAEMSLERGTYDECDWKSRKWMSLAIQFLPLEVESSTVVTLPTQWAAYATLPRITLYAPVRGITAISFMLTGNGRVTAQTYFAGK